jgi:trehalose 6-phosphate phosphatase
MTLRSTFLASENVVPRVSALDGVPEKLWRLVSLARHRLLMLDYDGTLAPFAENRDEAWPTPRSLELLGRIASRPRVTVAVISGRPVQEVERFLGPLGAIVAGEHGYELRTPDGRLELRPLAESAVAILDSAERLAREAGWGARLERKRSAVVLHTRSMPAPDASDLEARGVALWERLARGGVVSLDRIHGGLELRARGFDKGTVTRALLRDGPPGTLGVYVGDDVTDEDAFAAVRDRGFGVRVGDDARPTLAAARLPSCDALPDFLERWLAVLESAPGA